MDPFFPPTNTRITAEKNDKDKKKKKNDNTLKWGQQKYLAILNYDDDDLRLEENI